MANLYRSVKGATQVLPTGNAVEADVLAGKTFSNSSGTGKTGTMANRGAVTATVTDGQVYTIPAGYHNGNGTITGSMGVQSLTDCTFTMVAASTTCTYNSGITGKSHVAATKSHYQTVDRTYGTIGTTTLALSIDSSTGVVTARSTTQDQVFQSGAPTVLDLVIW